MNSLFQQLYRNVPTNPMQSIKSTIDMIKAAKNPSALAQTMVSKNPQVQKMIQDAGGDPKQAFYNAAKQKGIDPDEVLKMLK